MFRLHPGFRRPSSSSSEEELPPPNSNRVKRALFGPTDREENLRFVKNELKKARSEASNRWNFDFDSGTPLAGPFDWEEVKSNVAGRSIINPEKHSVIPASSDAKENRVGGDTGDPGPGGQLTPPVSTVSSHLPEATETDGLLSSTTTTPPSQEDLRTPPSSSTVTSSTPSISSSEASSSSLPVHAGARPKESTKDKKLTDMYPTRKPRSKSSSNLKKLKRLAQGTRSPSVKSRSQLPPGHSSSNVRLETRDSKSITQTSIPVTVSSQDDSSNSD